MELGRVDSPCTPHAVVLRHGCKSYGQVSVLKNLNMTVPRGTINDPFFVNKESADLQSYGLLGASGCGKTTLLSCVVGRLFLESGDVRVLGFTPGTPGSGIPGRRIGFMPQETALYLNFTIRDTMRYFGWIFDMKPHEVEERLQLLLNLLELSNADTITRNLSGGQMRRVSFAVALLHDPEVLVLDEPTVGMDPVLREVIWDYLMKLSTEGNKTVIVTTHYIEEAKQAHTIGLMRNGHLLEEDSPVTLLRKYNCSNLEDVFLHLSLQQERGKLEQNEVRQNEVTGDYVYEADKISQFENDLENHNKDLRDRYPKIPRGLISKGAMRALIFKNLVVSSRDLSYIAFVFGLIIIAVSSVHVGLSWVPRDVRIAVVNHDRGASRHDCADLPLGDDAGCTRANLSCHFLQHLGAPTVLKEFYNSTVSAVEAIQKGRAWGTLYFGTNFTEALVQRVLNSSRSLPSKIIGSSNIYVRLDMSNYVYGILLRQEILAAYDRFAENMLAKCNYSINLAHIPIRINEPIYGSYPINFIDFAGPGTMIVMAFFFGVALTTWCITLERKEGLVTRNQVAGVTTLEVFLSYLLSQTLLMVCQSVMLFVLGLYVYNFKCFGSVGLVMIIIVAQGFNGIILGLIISSACDRMETTNVLSIGSLVPMLVFCGIIWPVEGMDPPLRILSLLSPMTMPTKGLRAVMTRGWTIMHSDVYIGLAMSAAWTVVLCAACAVVFKIKKL